MKVSITHPANAIDIKKYLKSYPDVVLREPIVVQLTRKQWMVVLKFGVILFWGVTNTDQEAWIKKISPFFRDQKEKQQSDDAEVITKTKKMGVFKGIIHIKELTPDVIGVMSIVLGRSIALDDYEINVEQALTQFTPIMKSFEEEGRTRFRSRQLLKMLGKSMNVQHSIVSHITLLDKPDLTWEDSELDRFYQELNVEYELEERYVTLSEKLKLLFQHIEFIQNYLDTRRGLFLEWVIVILILFEIFLFIFEIWG